MISLKANKQDKEQPLQRVRKKQAEVLAPERYHFYVSKNKLVIINAVLAEPALLIERSSGKARLLDAKALGALRAKHASGEPRLYHAVFGQIVVKGVEFLILVRKACVAGEILHKKIFEVLSVEFFVVSQIKFEAKLHEKCMEHLSKIKEYLKNGFYFSYDYPLFASFRGEQTKNAKATEQMSKSIFVWNYKALKSLVPDVANSDFFVPFIQGYVGGFRTLKGSFLLISRRSFILGGTRYNARGIDNSGFVANFVESEQIFSTSFRIVTFLQYRGSLPFYWEQKGVKAKIRVHQELSINTDRFQKHLRIFKELFEIPMIVFFNLLGVNRGDENILTDYLLQILKQHGPDKNINYVHCDFHAITKETDYSAVDNYIKKIYALQLGQHVFQLKQGSSMRRLSQQKGTVRTNCMDCLDRTNAVQTKLSFMYLYETLKSLELDIFDDSLFDNEPLAFLQKSKNVYLEDFRRVWADNGDAISLIYAGTGATTSSVTRNGEKSGLTSFFDHGLKTISRFYLNNFDDSFKQEIIDELLNKKESTIRQSLLNFDALDIKKFQLGVVSVFGCKAHDMLELEIELLKNIFVKMSECHCFVFLYFAPRKTNIRIRAKDYLVYSNFHEVFKTFSPLMLNFEIFQSLSSKQFEIFLFKKKDEQNLYSFYKEKKITASFWKKQLGHKLSIIINDHQIEFFALNGESFKKEGETVTKLLNKYVDQYYDLIFILGNFQEEFDLNKIHPQFEHLFGNTLVFDKEFHLVNQVNLLCSKKLINQSLEPMEKEVNFDTSGMHKDFILNSRIFVLFDAKKVNQMQLSILLKEFDIIFIFFII